MNIIDIFQQFIVLIQNQDLVIKGVIIILLTLYTLFAIVVARQIVILNDIVNQVSFSPIFKIVAIIHILAAASLLIITVLSI